MATLVHTHPGLGPVAAGAAADKGILARLVDALIESRMRSAEREVRRIMAMHGYDKFREGGLGRLGQRKPGE